LILSELWVLGYVPAIMAEKKQSPGCARCAELDARVAALEAELAKAKKHSGNSSQPPSDDIVSPKKKNENGKRGRPKKPKRGGQPGHKRHLRTPFMEVTNTRATDGRAKT
jgi:hypothetical protein